MPVYLVGAGPGDPELITAKGLRCIRSADVIIYDYLAPRELLREARPGCELIDVGKRGGQAHIYKEEVNAILLDRAQRGGVVVRLKGGDPFVFGRGGEEALLLARRGVAFEVVPGVTSGVAAAAYAGVPLTHRGLASSVALCTAREDPAKPESAVDWEALARMGTACFYMGARRLAETARKLMEAGKPGDTPAAVIRWGATPRQRTVVAELSRIADEAGDVQPPALLVVGEVVRLREEINWFESKPLFGRTIVVTRTRAQASELRRLLADQGAWVVEMPLIEIVEPDDWSAADAAIAELERFDWVAFTSPNGVERFFGRLWAAGRDARALARARLAVIGPATGRKLEEFQLRPDLAPDEHTSEGLLAALARAGAGAARVLIPLAQDAPDDLPNGLRRLGADVAVVPVYKTVMPQDFDPEAADAFARGEVDLVTAASRSTVEHLRRLLDAGLCKPAGAVRLASIGPVTSRAARRLGFEAAVEAPDITIPSLVDAIVKYFAAPRG